MSTAQPNPNLFNNKKKYYFRLFIIIFGLMIAILLLYLTLTYVLNVSNYSFLFNFKKINWYYASYIIIFPFIFAFLFGITQWFFLIISVKNYRFSDAFFLGFGYNLFVAISPFGFFGDIFKIYIFTRNKIKIEKIIPAIVLNSFFYQLFSFLISIFAIIYLSLIGAINVFFTHGISSILVFFFIIGGLIVDLCYVIFLSMIIFSKQFHNLISNLIIYFMSLFRILKTSEAKITKKEHFMVSFNLISHNFKQAFRSYMLFWWAIIFTILLIVVRALVPWFAFKSIDSISNISIWSLINASIMIEIANNLVPIPSGSGILEIAFFNLYHHFWNIPRLTVERIILITRFALTFEVIFVGLFFLPVSLFHTTKHHVKPLI